MASVENFFVWVHASFLHASRFIHVVKLNFLSKLTLVNDLDYWENFVDHPSSNWPSNKPFFFADPKKIKNQRRNPIDFFTSTRWLNVYTYNILNTSSKFDSSFEMIRLNIRVNCQINSLFKLSVTLKSQRQIS